ncbi:uncharacterized protein N0V89_011108 [Didymosphaeria variabile]|uniref:SGNH hydrolase-type esterase domain-containing protein n=1 Tax=Didymosphaeria variabile TaxID=1932322 RepID=A0A9W8XCX2_9PLEO|nr:uncharacterized protein N0V89_011108 [Didymosphaeria variabile]KAJ4347170.1 hypothetical protein N0V89_011108 [Didymosphaeria variabile]
MSVGAITTATAGSTSQAQPVPSIAPSTETIPFASAVQIEASASMESQRLASIPAIPLPTNTTQYPQYQAARKIAPVMPPVQAGVKFPERPDMVANLTPSFNTSTFEQSHFKRQASSTRVLVVGDSITQGQQGDYTWRYRIWQWFQSSGIPVQMVGPYKGTKSPPPPRPPQPPPLYGAPADTSFTTDGGYAAGVDSEFLSQSNHFAVWGRAAAVDKALIAGVLQQNPADLMLLFLGFNDLGWFYSDVAGTLASIQTLITNARSVNPSLKFAVANIPHRTHIGGRDDLVSGTDLYNGQLPGLLSRMSTTQSPIHLVDIAGNYDCQDDGCPAGK